MILVTMERGNPTLYYDAKQLYFGRVNFKFTGSGNPPQEDVLQKKKKGSGRRGLTIVHSRVKNANLVLVNKGSHKREPIK